MMRFLYSIILSFAILLSSTSAVKAEPEIRPNLQQLMPGLKSDTLVRINIVMQQQYAVSDLQKKFNHLDHQARRDAVIDELKSFSVSTQQDLLNYLGSEQTRGSVNEVRTLWISNIINCYVKPGVILELAKRTDIRSIDLDVEQLILEHPQVIPQEQILAPAEITWNVLRVNAPQVWEQGFTGQNVVVSVIDSGVNYEHNDLGNMWEHPNFPFHGWNFVGNNNDPMDDHGHGTHVAGTVAGNGASGSATGVAPGATIMAVKAVTSAGTGSEFNAWAAIEFSVNFGAHIINFSLGWTALLTPDRASWRNVMDNTLAAGVIASVVAGNEGNNLYSFPIPSNVRTPGDCPPPWLHPDQTLTGGISSVVTVGAADMNDNLAGFSSMGPVSWSSIPGFNDYPYNPGMGLMRPDVVAPGVNIRSLAHFSNTDYVDGWQGTSMAAPCVAGTMALLLSKNPSLSPAQISQALEETAISSFPVKNNQVGSGLIDAYASYNAIPFPGPSYYAHVYHDASEAVIDSIFPGLSALLTLSLKNTDSTLIENVHVKISSSSPYISITDSVAYFGSFEPGEIVTKDLAYAFFVSDTIPGGSMIRFEINSYNDDGNWMSTFTDIAFGPNLISGAITVIDSLGNNNNRLDPGETAIIQILNTNIGQWPTSNALAELTSASPYITFETESNHLGVLQPGDTTYSAFQVQVDPLTPEGTVIELEYTVSSFPYLLNQFYYQTVGLVIEDFETGGFSSFNWKHFGYMPWIVAPGEVYEGNYASHSPQITHNQYARLSISITVASFDSISFYRKVSSEEYFDFLNFYINDYVVGRWSGELDWERIVFEVPPGPVTFSWEYRKDQNTSMGSDKAWIDYIVFPGMLEVNAGDDKLVCPGESVQLNGTARNHSYVLWSTTGDGSFSDPTLLDPIYNLGEEDILNSGVSLKLTAYGLNTYAMDEIELMIIPPPQVFAGSNTNTCDGMPVELTQATVSFADSVRWSSTGTGVFDDPGSVNPTYFPSEADMNTNLIQLTLKAYGINGCTTQTSSLYLFFNKSPVVFAGPDTILCAIYHYYAVHASAVNFSGLFWTSSGTGTFNNPAQLKPVYNPSQADHERGFVNLTLHAAGINTCPNASSSLTLFFVPRAVAWAGSDLMVCRGDSVQITNDSTAHSNSILWTSTGSGTFNNNAMLHPVYYPSAADYDKGVIQLIMRAFGHASCPPDEHSVFVNFIGEPPTPLKPLGPDSVDVFYEPLTHFSVMGVYLALDFEWELLPHAAGTITADTLDAYVEWNPDFNGEVEIRVKALNNCGESLFSSPKTIRVYSSVGIRETEKSQVRIIPIPAKDHIEIWLPENVDPTFRISIANLEGKVFYDKEFTGDASHRLIIDVSTFQPGVYLVRIQSSNMNYNSRIIIAR